MRSNPFQRAFYFRTSQMTLLETLIALSLLAMLLTMMFSFFKEISVLGQSTEEKQKESFQMRYLENRLQYIFERIVNDNEGVNGRDFFFYTQPANRAFSHSESLIFTFDNGVRSTPYYSGDILARLYVDLKNRLHLTTWPLRIENPYLHQEDEILLEDVGEIKFSFYAPPDKEGSPHKTGAQVNLKNVNGREEKVIEPEKDKWYDDWLFEYDQMPAILKIELVRNVQQKDLLIKGPKEGMGGGDTIDYSFVLPTSKNPIHYPKS